MLLIGLAVGVDYSLFYLKREREERAAGRSERAALEAAAATSGRSVLVSGLTVMTAMAGMFLTGDPVFESFAIATIAVVAIAMIGSLTVLPALLSRPRRPRRPGPRATRRPAPPRRRREPVWGAIVNGVLRRPLLSAVLAGGLLVALAIPGPADADGQAGPRHVPAVAPRRADVRADAAGVPRLGSPGQRGRQGSGRELEGDAVRDPAAPSAGCRLRAHARADHRRGQRRRDGCGDQPDRRQGHRLRLERVFAQLRNEIVPATVGAVAGAEQASPVRPPSGRTARTR